MCGILGKVSTLQVQLDKALKLIQHRGPDFTGVYYDKIMKYNIGFGHTRLSIIDLDQRSNQPFKSFDDNYIVVFNGEIYNYKELRNSLKKLGYSFYTNSDTEVLLNMYIHYGYDMLFYLNGMFSFSILDKRKRIVFSAVDQLGIKPFYYHYTANSFEFSSEITPLFSLGINKMFNPDILAEFIQHGWLYKDLTPYKNIKKLPSGHSLILDLHTFNLTINEYYNVLKSAKHVFIDDPIETVRNIINYEINLQSHSDVRQGNFFSGGIDSTVIATFLKRNIDNLIVKYNDKEINQSASINDFDYAKKIAKHLNIPLTTIEFSLELDSYDKINFVASQIDDLISDYTFLSTYLISKKSSELGYKTMLSGMGADEIFGGYPRYKVVKYSYLFSIFANNVAFSFMNKLKSYEKKIDRFNNFFKYYPNSFSTAYGQLLGYFSFDEVKNIVPKHSFDFLIEHFLLLDQEIQEIKSPLKKAMYIDLYGFLNHNFIITDKASMLNSVEVRVPLATTSLLEFTFNIDDLYLLDIFETKKLLKNLLLNLEIPKKYIYRPKVGFNPPLDNLIVSFHKERDLIKTIKTSPLNDYINTDPLLSFINEHFKGKKNNTYKIWQMLFLHFWIKNHV